MREWSVVLSVGTRIVVASEATRPEEVLRDVTRYTVGKETFLEVAADDGRTHVVNARHVVAVAEHVHEPPEWTQ